ncbi:MAG: hypothetical protein ACN4E4_11000, partial [Methyloversatilis discipulorum]
MLPDRFLRPALLATVLAIVAPGALAFSFSEDAKKDAAAAEESRAAAHVLSLPPACLDELRRRKIMIVMGERTGEGVTAEQARFSPHFN